MMFMDLDYTAYPNQAWVSNWPLTPFNINPISRTAHSSSFYTDKLEGRVNIRQCEMALQLNLQRMNKKMLLHDLIGAYTYEDEDEKKIEILCMNTNTLWGRCIQAPLPNLLNDHLMSTRDNGTDRPRIMPMGIKFMVRKICDKNFDTTKNTSRVDVGIV